MAASADEATQTVMDDPFAQKVHAEAKEESNKPRPIASPVDDVDGSDYEYSYYSDIEATEPAVDDEMRPVPAPSAARRRRTPHER